MIIAGKKKLGRSFFQNNTVEVAKNLLGKILVFNDYQGIITETEAYRGEDDPASHAFKFTPRSRIMFGKAGISYVYLIYGMYHCLNIVTETEGVPGAVLIRGIKQLKPHEDLLDGPGKICRRLEINLNQNNIDLIDIPNFYVADAETISDFVAGPRIGIKKGLDKQWRFLLSSQF